MEKEAEPKQEAPREPQVSMEQRVAETTLGERMVHGPDQASRLFGIGAEDAEAPPYSQEELDRAKERGEMLVYRVAQDAEGNPLTMKRMAEMLRQKGKPAFSNPDASEIEAAGSLGMEFFTDETPEPGWKLVKVDETPETRHLSFEAQQAFLKDDWGAVAKALEEIPKRWDESGVPEELRPALPSLEDLQRVRKDLPEDAELPRAVDVMYDLLMHQSATGEDLLRETTVATKSRNQEIPEEGVEERPIDVGFFGDEGLFFHWRRNKGWGRQLENDPKKKPGVPIGYLQH